MFQIGDKVLHQFNREFGPGEVISVGQGRMTVRFPRLGETLQFGLDDHAFVPLVLPAGTDPERWAEEWSDDLVERLLRREVDTLRALRNRLDALRLMEIREADGLGSYLGGRLRVFPHQIHVAEAACQTDPVRWLLADEVGLGKTVEACLILSRLLRTKRAERVMVIAPRTLAVQWLGELYRKFHQIFVLLDEERRNDVWKDMGAEFNPFEVHARSVVPLEDLVQDTRAQRAAIAARPDLLVIDEAHRLERRPGHPGSPAYRTVAPITGAARHALLLSATPLEADTHGFFRLLELLWPERFSSWETFQNQLREGIPLYPCTSSTRRIDIGGLPPRLGQRVELEEWPELEFRLGNTLAMPAARPLERHTREEAVQRSLAAPVPERDLRLEWILSEAPRWKRRREKSLLFVGERAALDFLKQELEFKLHQRVAVFHEDLSLAQRDLEVSQFAQPDGPSLLISTECGGEGRNFEFCRRLILFDLPWNAALVEQRIGRLDRISRTRPVEIVYFRPGSGFAREVAELYEALGIFKEPLGGLERSLTHVEAAIREAVHQPEPSLDLESILTESRELRARTHDGVYQHLHQNRYTAAHGPEIVARIPAELERLNEQVIVEACRQFGFEVVDRAEKRTWYIEFGALANIDDLSGISPGSRWLGTFDREAAVERETLDFFGAGHPLVEGVLDELTHGHRGQVALLSASGTKQRAHGLLLVLKRGATFEMVPIDLEGRVRNEWLPILRGESGRLTDLHPSRWNPPESFADLARAVLQHARQQATPVALAGVELLP
ncbi:MAG: DEAD/DEAH box helicase family protein [Candidatus Eisenbacteria bacterium]|nr:DEAD/DEAH box helicase family protein [Candidatus Eisenbacteria bacterium]